MYLHENEKTDKLPKRLRHGPKFNPNIVPASRSRTNMLIVSSTFSDSRISGRCSADITEYSGSMAKDRVRLRLSDEFAQASS